ncbi:MAG: flagellar hook-associated protein FlgK [Cellulosilyticaceae bacterium]
MSSISSIGKMVSGLVASQVGLQVTGHNLSNMNTPGYTRQQLLLHDSSYVTIGNNGKQPQKIGLGVSLTEIRQVRDEFADKRFRTESSTLNYYTVKQSAISEVEAILDEPHGSAMTKMLDNFWSQMQKLSTNPGGVEERLAFIQTAHVLMEKANHISDSLNTYQHHLNTEVINSVKRINEITKGISSLNESINGLEINGDNANDLRDQRNLLLDELSQYMNIEYYEDRDGRVVVKGEGQTLVDKQFVTEIKLKQTEPGSAFVEPIWGDTGKPLYAMDRALTSDRGNDNGRLQGLLAARGRDVAGIDTPWEEIALNDKLSVDESGNAYLIPKLQKELAIFINRLTEVVNENLNGMGIDGNAGVPVFVPKSSIDGTALPVYPTYPADPTDTAAMAQYEADRLKYLADIQKHMTPGNIQVNPALMADGGYNRLGTVSKPGDVGDNSLVTKLLGEWSKSREWPGDGSTAACKPKNKNTNFTDFYAEFVAEIGREGFQAKGKVKEKSTMVTTIDNQRLAMGGVSQDEELSNMLKYQHAYNASSRMVNVLDDMMDTIINRM